MEELINAVRNPSEGRWIDESKASTAFSLELWGSPKTSLETYSILTSRTKEK